MTTMRILPSRLADLPDPAALNRELRDGAVHLNWGNVTEVDADTLAALLAGLALDRDEEAIGIGTASDDLAEVIDGLYMATTEAIPIETPAAPAPVAMPALWKAPVVPLPDELDEDDDEPSPPLPVPLGETPGAAALRDELARLIVADLLGPQGGEDEEILDAPRERYLVGTLPPARRQDAPEPPDDGLAEGGADDAESGAADVPTAAPQLTPSSFGLTVCVALDAPALTVTARWGRYEHVLSERLKNDAGQPRRVWKRTPMGGTPRRVTLAEGNIEPWRPDPDAERIFVRGTIRRAGEVWLATFWIVNDGTEPHRNRDQAWAFQPELILAAPDGGAIFRRRATLPVPTDDAVHSLEEAAIAMRYRRRREFAVGHGIGVHVERDSDDPACAHTIRTQVLPQYEVAAVTETTPDDLPALAGLPLDMSVLSTTPSGEWGARLASLPRAYAAWIEAQHARLADANEELDKFGLAPIEALRDCRVALARITEGIALLDRDEQAADAFRFANRAMWQQRIHTLVAEAARSGEPKPFEEFDAPHNRSWRLFQLAFILLNLPSLTDLHHAERGEGSDATADLLWFPTGGGKTEAYLGLTAYTLAVRRLQGTVAGRSGMDGVAVLMRYTLRLLTVQQFQRAASLICACEALRREAVGRGDDRWGASPFRLGLWVGQRSTPNTNEQSHRLVQELRKSGQHVGGVGTPAQLTHCPWCGTPIDPGRHIVVDLNRKRTILYCGDPHGDCLFTPKRSPDEGLPVLVVDEEIYRWLPALLIATVDKFARMPWEPATQMLFGQVDGRCPRRGFRAPAYADEPMQLPKKGALPAVRVQPHGPLRPPDLIIQDELHLISGPLGTLVGLYETAVDRLCSWDVQGRRVRPKVIASTATVRRAGDQMRALFARTVAIFPPQGFDVEDNFFARERPTTTRPGRLYLGICAPGKRLKAILIRMYVAQMAAAQLLWDRYGPAADAWMTLVGYFNAMRELGGMRRLVEDDVTTRLQRATDLGLAKRRPPMLHELTSRMGAGDIPKVLAQLEVPYAAGFGPKKRGAARPIDVLLATNMISVGVDVRRLGAMIVAGQPKTTAEYIQATSRVGRAHPGIVCTVLNWARPRDLSHYEQFEHYHATFYRHIEALSVTPFSPRAIDRGLTGVLVSYARLAGIEMNADDRAGHITREKAPIPEAIEVIAKRAAAVTDHPTEQEIRAELNRRIDYWMGEAAHVEGGRVLRYGMKRDGITVPLLRHSGAEEWELFTCLNSLRDVEATVSLLFDERALDPENPPPFVAVADVQKSEDTAIS